MEVLGASALEASEVTQGLKGLPWEVVNGWIEPGGMPTGSGLGQRQVEEVEGARAAGERLNWTLCLLSAQLKSFPLPQLPALDPAFPQHLWGGRAGDSARNASLLGDGRLGGWWAGWAGGDDAPLGT